MTSSYSFHEADLSNEEQAQAVIDLLTDFARDVHGENYTLPDQTLVNLIPRLQQHPTSRVFLAHSEDTHVGLAICFENLSTFSARPLVNIHDLVIRTGWRCRGVGTAMIEHIAAWAQARGCCRLTLEVQETNRHAMSVYRKTGFADCKPRQLFWTRDLGRSRL